jgi:hypothetical protein
MIGISHVLREPTNWNFLPEILGQYYKFSHLNAPYISILRLRVFAFNHAGSKCFVDPTTKKVAFHFIAGRKLSSNLQSLDVHTTHSQC